MASTVYFADMRAGHKENLFDKISRLLACCGIEKVISAGDLVAVKLHFGEKGNHAFIRPVFIRRVVEEIRKVQGKPFLTDSSTLYPGERKEAVSALSCAIENGFAYAVVNAPLIMCDGIKGQNAVQVKIAGELLQTVSIGAEIVEADALVTVSHFKCHELTGFGGALKNLGMGCASRTGKMQQHSTVAPIVA
ncbi:MAG: 4Fe-4S ferredoxin, iron-sulfur binding domain protein, partial [Deltaproteobacteria bacterium]|nr:4Fe-4S ferredoxin, iron-sulfur binding domain protein [Deltaproteobacteria bacterium]